MKKLLVLALLGLILGAGAWKVQNPDGTLDDARTQAAALGERLKSGVQAVRQPLDQTATDTHQQTLDERLALLEQSIVSGSSVNLPTEADELSSVAQDTEAGTAADVASLNATDSQAELLEQRLDEQTVEQSLQNIQDTIDGLGTDVASLRESASTRDAAVTSELAALGEQIAALDVRLDNLTADTTASTDDSAEAEDTSDNSSRTANNAQDIQSALESQSTSPNQSLEDMGPLSPELVDNLAASQQNVEQAATDDSVTEDDPSEQIDPQAVEYKIYFDRDSVAITDAAATVLNSFITQEKNRTTGVSIYGFTDPLGPAVYNQQLALQRATNVRSYLIENGFDESKINALNGLGEDVASVVLPDNADAAQQRVVVLYASQP